MILVLKLGGIFALVVVLMAIRAPISAAIAAGAILIGILFSMPVLQIGDAFLTSLVDFYTINFLFVVYFIRLLSLVMKEAGALTRFSKGSEYLLRGSRAGIVSAPLFVGLLPMPGGALLTAPMVAEQAKPHGIKPGLLTYLNYWFRHVWEYFWPLYPPVILGMAILGINWNHYLVNQSFMTIAALSVGTIVLFSFVKRRTERPQRAAGKAGIAWKNIVYGVFPVAALMVLIGLRLIVQGVAAETSTLSQVSEKFPLAAFMFLVIIVAWFVYKPTWKATGKILLKALDWRVLTLLVAVMFFREIFSRSTAVTELELFMQAAPTTLLPLLVIGLPFSVGLLIGLNQAYVGVAFPLLAPFIAKSPGLIMLAYVFGFLGCLLSPAHLCLAFSREYFKAKWGRVYMWLLPSVMALAGIAVGAWFIFFKQ